MNIRRTALALALAGSFAAPLAVHAANVNLDIDIAPPAPVYEQMPARAGYVVTPGYYRYDSQQHEHVWVKGDYQAERRGEHYVASEWSKQDGRYHFNEGRWEHDK
jgi:WXXGXW repeat (2 copies)